MELIYVRHWPWYEHREMPAAAIWRKSKVAPGSENLRCLLNHRHGLQGLSAFVLAADAAVTAPFRGLLLRERPLIAPHTVETLAGAFGAPVPPLRQGLAAVEETTDWLGRIEVAAEEDWEALQVRLWREFWEAKGWATSGDRKRGPGPPPYVYPRSTAVIAWRAARGRTTRRDHPDFSAQNPIAIKSRLDRDSIAATVGVGVPVTLTDSERSRSKNTTDRPNVTNGTRAWNAIREIPLEWAEIFGLRPTEPRTESNLRTWAARALQIQNTADPQGLADRITAKARELAAWPRARNPLAAFQVAMDAMIAESKRT